MDENVHIGKVVAAAALIVLGVLFAGAAAWMVSTRSGTDRAGPNQPSDVRVEGPQLQSAPRVELAAFQREKRARLENYGWVDRDAGRVHIPIGRAMQLMAERQ